MKDLRQIGSRAVQRLLRSRARPDAPLPAAIGEAVRAEGICADIRIFDLGPGHLHLQYGRPFTIRTVGRQFIIAAG